MLSRWVKALSGLIQSLAHVAGSTYIPSTVPTRLLSIVARRVYFTLLARSYRYPRRDRKPRYWPRPHRPGGGGAAVSRSHIVERCPVPGHL